MISTTYILKAIAGFAAVGGLLALTGCAPSSASAADDWQAVETGFVCTPVAVWDGDTYHCAEKLKIRISGIAARETDGSCSPGHPCPAASAEAARDALVGLFGGPRGRWKQGHIVVQAPPMKCDKRGMSYDRVVADCLLPDGRDLSGAMLASGTVLPWR